VPFFAPPPPPLAQEVAPEPEPEAVSEPIEPVAPMPEPVAAAQRPDIEALLTARWGVWLGAGALVLAGVFLVNYAVDEGRIYLTGVSMGGAGAWRLASAYPERFAAIAPICGVGDPSTARRLAKIPTWVFHGAKDDLVPLQASQEMVDALREVGNAAKFTIYPDAGHDSWTPTYNNPALFDWFLNQKRQAPSVSHLR